MQDSRLCVANRTIAYCFYRCTGYVRTMDERSKASTRIPHKEFSSAYFLCLYCPVYIYIYTMTVLSSMESHEMSTSQMQENGQCEYHGCTDL